MSEGEGNRLAASWAQLGNRQLEAARQRWTLSDIPKYLMALVFVLSAPFLRVRGVRVGLAVANAIYLVGGLVFFVFAVGLFLFGVDPRVALLCVIHSALIFAVLIASRDSEVKPPH